MNFVEEKTRAETIYQRQLTDQEFAETLLERIKVIEEMHKAMENCCEDLTRKLEEATKPDEWTDIRNKVEEILSMPGKYHEVTVHFTDCGVITMDFSVDGLPIKSTVEDWEGEF